MKISLSWIFDHIQMPESQKIQNIDIDDLSLKFSATTAEIEQVTKIMYDIKSFSLVRVLEIKEQEMLVEHSKRQSLFKGSKSSLPFRQDAQIGTYFLLKKDNKEYRYATLGDFHSEKESLMPPLWCTKEEFEGGWEHYFEQDYILHFDNKSLTHRPDLWGHRGFAREVAALLGLKLIPEERIFSSKPVLHFTSYAPTGPDNAIALEIKNNSMCKRLAGISLSLENAHASHIAMAKKLAQLDIRPFNFVVDTTNFVMLDIGQPMHAFDASTIEGNMLSARAAHAHEQLMLLDGEIIKLTSDDCIIADEKKPISLAGIMGGEKTAVRSTSKHLFLESAHFDAATIRLTAARYKKRTEASLRFEKSLDPHQNTLAIARFIKIVDEVALPYTSGEVITSVGPLTQEQIITLSHTFIEERLGMTVSYEKVMPLLKELGFGIRIDEQTHNYIITIPTFRGTKEKWHPEDILEEIARYIGYANIPLQSPSRIIKPLDTHVIHKTRTIKQHCAYALNLHEVSNYALYDEEWLREIHLNLPDGLSIQNPVSEHWRRLVGSLVPHLLKNISQNQGTHVGKTDKIGFFEMGKIWEQKSSTQPREQQSLAALFFAYKNTLNFYTIKADIQKLFAVLEMPVIWRKPRSHLAPWFNVHQTAELVCDDKVIGYAGMLLPYLATYIADGQGFVMELNADYLINYQHTAKEFTPLTRYQPVAHDISMKVPFALSVTMLESAIAHADYRIKEVSLIDYFENPEWEQERAITLRYIMVDEHKTMTKEEIDTIEASVKKTIGALGVEIR